MCRGFVWVTLALVLTSVPAAAQVSLRSQMSRLFETSLLLARTPSGVGLVAHTPTFTEDPVFRETTDLVNQVSAQIGLQLANVPLGSSGGGLTYGFDSTLGTFSRTTETFGPAYAERAATVGADRYAVGVNYVHRSYTALDGLDLPNGDIRFNLFHERLTPASYVEGDVVQVGVRMRLTSDAAVFHARYGVTDNFDVGMSLPVVRVRMDLVYRARILDFATGTVSPSTHLFGNGSKTQDFNASGDASGLGDIVLRGRYSFASRGAPGVAAGLDLRLPSGDADNMLGTGATQTRFFFIASGRGRVSPHVNLGYTVSSGNAAVPNEVTYASGVELGASPRVTLLFDVFGQTSSDALRVQNRATVHTFRQGPTAPIERTTLTSVAVSPSTLTSGMGAVGAKINVWRNALVSANVLVPIAHAGLRSRASFVAGFDYTF